MKKIILSLFALCATTFLWAYDFQSGDLYYNITSNTTVEVTYQEAFLESNYSGLTSVTIPSTVTYNGTTYSVTSIGDYAFYKCSSLTSVTIPNSVTSIGSYAFDGTGIYNNESNWENDVLYIDNCLIAAKTSISGAYAIKENTRLIGERAFSDCSSLTSITIPNSVTSIGDYAFYKCSSLTSVTIPNSVTSIGSYAFDGTGIYNNESNWENDVLYIDNCLIAAKTSISGAYAIKENTRLIGERAFSDCSSLTSVTIPNSVTSIGMEAFADCSSLTSMVVAEGNTVFDSRENCNAIIKTATNTLIAGCQNTIIPNSVTSIGNSAFAWCTSLTSITIPNSVTSIGDYAFCDAALTSIVVPDNVTFIGKMAFSDMEETLKSAVIGSGVKELNETFGECLSLESVILSEGLESIGDGVFSVCTFLSSVNIPNSVTSIGEEAFAGCSSLTSITIPSSVTSIEGESVFAGCIFVKENFINNSSLDAQANNYWGATIVDSETDGLIIRNDTVIRCRPNVISANIPANVTTIGDFAFYYCTSITSITIPNSVTSIGRHAFWDCSSLTSVTIGNSVTSIGDWAFYECSSLTSVTIPNSVTTIGDFAFYYCTSLSSVTCLAMTPSAMGVLVFGECNNPTLFVLCNALSDYQAHKQWGQFANIECIGAEAVETEEVVIESGTTTISITWPTEESADTYTIVVKKADEVVCTLIFNADGQLINATFAPGRNGNHPVQYAEQAGKGFRFTVTGLTEATQYAYNITTKDADNNTIATYSGEFTTKGGTTNAVEDILQNTTNVQKLLRDGQLIIVRDGIEYNAMGQEL